MTRDEREALRAAIDRAARAKLAAEREPVVPPKRDGPVPRLDDSEALGEVERVLGDGRALSVRKLAREVGISWRQTSRALGTLVALGVVEEVPGPGWAEYRLRADRLRDAA